MRQEWEEWIRQDRPTTKAGNLKQPTRQDVIDWVSRAWASIEQAITVHSFLVCGLANALDGTEDDKASDDIPDIPLSDEDEEDQENQDPSDSDVDSMGDPFSDEDSEDSEDQDVED